MRIRALAPLTLSVLSAWACEEKERPSLAPAERSQVIEQKGTATQAPTAAPTPSATTATTPKPHRALCGGHLDAEGKPAPKKPISRMAASGEPELAEDPSFSGGFTWVNFWAAWCAPCKEEIPRLMGWQKKLAGSGKTFRVHFISLDDDERQLQKFLGEQPPSGLRSTYWLEEGKKRDDWLASAGVDPNFELPIHLLVDQRGKIRCRVQGAIEDADYADLLRLLGG